MVISVIEDGTVVLQLLSCRRACATGLRKISDHLLLRRVKIRKRISKCTGFDNTNLEKLQTSPVLFNSLSGYM